MATTAITGEMNQHVITQMARPIFRSASPRAKTRSDKPGADHGGERHVGGRDGQPMAGGEGDHAGATPVMTEARSVS